MIHNDAQFVASYNPDINKTEFNAAWKKRAAGGQGEVQGYVPHYKGSPIVYEQATAAKNNLKKTKPGAAGQHSHKAEAGVHLSPQQLSNGRDSASQLGERYTLILIDSTAALQKKFQSAANAAGISLSIVRSAPTSDTDRWQASIILVRPDHFIAYATDRLDVDPALLLAHCTGNNGTTVPSL